MSGLWEVVRATGAAGRAVLATVVKVEGSAYRRPGARMLFPESGEPVGIVSGGCLEGDLAERARGVLSSGEPCTVVYDMRSPDDIVWGLGLGCNGAVRVLLERLEPGCRPAWLDFIAHCSKAREPGVVATIFDASEKLEGAVGQRLTLAADGTIQGTAGEPGLTGMILRDAGKAMAERRSAVRLYETSEGRAEGLIEFVSPAVSLLVFGAGGDALPLVRLAAQLGWQVTVADNRPGLTNPRRFPEADAVKLVDFDSLDGSGLTIDGNTPVVVMTHHFLHDLELLRFLLPTEAPYLGILGPHRRTENLLRELSGRGVQASPAQLSRLHGPVGLDIGSETPEEIALAVLAEIRAVLSRRHGGFLRDRDAPLHDWPT